jgi:putative SOS response-associated peptidase YedK
MHLRSYIDGMCGRITQKNSPRRLGLGLVTVNLIEPLYAPPPRYNGAPSQEHWVIRQNPKTRERTLDQLTWGLGPQLV